ncbi:glycosyltransferase family 2 protein [Stemphylium lycopersici]|uniref:Glycosyltransferase family 2 protein n=1 Tax=Stemphylium lycopersici TaxID=183478 RepID=A0A364NB86_STELY|nr:glycosyltransferase family 2 protein [Stemphylium lycopersici]RAR14588.1 glycosyltransferase family 2 protein [Stemphylium lycopersici]
MDMSKVPSIYVANADEILPIPPPSASNSYISSEDAGSIGLHVSKTSTHATEELPPPRPAFFSSRSSRSSSGWSEHPPPYPYGTPSSSTTSLALSQSESLPLRQGAPKRDRRGAVLRVFSAVKRKIFNHVHPRTIWQTIDIREVFWPFTWKKYIILSIVAALAVGVGISDHYFGWIQKSMEITRSNMLPVLIIVIGLEPIMITIILLVARVPPLHPPVGPPVEKAAPDVELDVEKAVTIVEATQDHRTALVIPCHNSDHEATSKVLKSAFVHFRPQDIFVVDNGRTRHPPSPEFREFIRSEHPDINYIWSPIGSKNAAQLVGAMAATSYEWIMTVDDDVSIPATFRPPIDKMDDVTKGCAFPLKAVDANGDVPLCLVAWQDCEYKMSGLTKLAESSICGVLYPHGAGWFCERETLIDLISNYHSIDFIAEDVNTGLSMQKMKKRIAFDATCVLETEVPTTILGPGLNWWNQRYRSWEMGRHGRLLAFADRMLLSLNGQTTPWGIFTQKFIHLYSIATIIVDWVRIPVFVTMGGDSNFWLLGGPLMLAATLPILAFKYFNARHRPDLQPRFWAAMTYPLYKQLYALVSIFGAIRAVLFYAGGHTRPKTIKRMVEEKDPNAVWLDPRFQSNPAYLADEAEALLRVARCEGGEKGWPSVHIAPASP